MTLSPSALSLHATSPPPSAFNADDDFYGMIGQYNEDDTLPPHKNPYRIKLVAAIQQSRQGEHKERLAAKARAKERLSTIQPDGVKPGVRARTFDTAASRRRQNAQKKMYNTSAKRNAQQSNFLSLDGGDSIVGEPGKSFGKWRLDDDEYVSAYVTKGHAVSPNQPRAASPELSSADPATTASTYVRPKTNVASKANLHQTLMQHSTPVRIRPKSAPLKRPPNNVRMQPQRMKGMLNPVSAGAEYSAAAELAATGAGGDAFGGLEMNGTGVKSAGGKGRRPGSAHPSSASRVGGGGGGGGGDQSSPIDKFMQRRPESAGWTRNKGNYMTHVGGSLEPQVVPPPNMPVPNMRVVVNVIEQPGNQITSESAISFYENKSKEFRDGLSPLQNARSLAEADGLFVNYRVPSPTTVQDLNIAVDDRKEGEMVLDGAVEVEDADAPVEAAEEFPKPHPHPNWSPEFETMEDFNRWVKKDVESFLLSMRKVILAKRPEHLKEFVVDMLTNTEEDGGVDDVQLT
jgi:hypothetical protein